MKRRSRPSCDDVLDAFAVEPEIGRATLERYLREFPEYAADIVDLAVELMREAAINDQPLSQREQNLIAAAWGMHAAAAPKSAANPFAKFKAVQLQELAQVLEVSQQVLTAFRERTILAASVPQRFLIRLASGLGTELKQLITYLEAPPSLRPSRSYKAETKPMTGKRVTFEQLLIDAGIPEDQRRRLMIDS
jgi:hypothetical protein